MIPQYKKTHKKQHTLQERFEKFLQKIPFLKNLSLTREVQLIVLFFAMFGVLAIRLFYLQVIQHNYYETRLNTQHTRSTSVKADRGNIYALDKTGQPVKLTENISLYDIALDPTLVGETKDGLPLKSRLIGILTPVVYKHLCVINGMDQVTPE